LLRELAKVVPLVVMGKSDVNDVIAGIPGIVNLGIVDQAKRDETYRQAKFLIGLGDPVYGDYLSHSPTHRCSSLCGVRSDSP
jgi:hypothetical protein